MTSFQGSCGKINKEYEFLLGLEEFNYLHAINKRLFLYIAICNLTCSVVVLHLFER